MRMLFSKNGGKIRVVFRKIFKTPFYTNAGGDFCRINIHICEYTRNGETVPYIAAGLQWLLFGMRDVIGMRGATCILKGS